MRIHAGFSLFFFISILLAMKTWISSGECRDHITLHGLTQSYVRACSKWFCYISVVVTSVFGCFTFASTVGSIIFGYIIYLD